MYKNPELSAQAKLLRGALQAVGLELTHAQALEALAKAQGSRTLHVAHARKSRQGADIKDLALRQAVDIVFQSLGRYEGNVLGLLEEMKMLALLDDPREADDEFRRIMRSDGSPLVCERYGDLRVDDELPEEFERVRQRLEETLRKQFDVPAPVQGPTLLYKGPALDWQVSEGTPLAELPKHQQTRYDIKVERSTHQVFVEVAVPHGAPEEADAGAQLSLFIEINKGRPCVHIGNACYGEKAISVFGTRDGLLLRPDGFDEQLRKHVPEAAAELRDLHAELLADFPRDDSIRFIPSKVSG